MMDFFKKKFRKKNVNQADGKTEKSDEDIRETFTILQPSEEEYDPLEYDQQQVCQCYGERAEAPHLVACRRPHQFGDETAPGCNSEPVGYLSRLSHDQISEDGSSIDASVPSSACQCEMDTSLTGRNEEEPVSTFCSIGKGDDRMITFVVSGDDDRNVTGSYSFTKNDDPCEYGARHTGHSKESETFLRIASSGDGLSHREAVAFSARRCSSMKKYEYKISQNQDSSEDQPLESLSKGEDMQSSESLSSVRSSSASSRDSVSHGSYTLWPDIHDKELLCIADDFEEYYTPESTMKRSSGSRENLNNDLVLHGLSELVPRLEDPAPSESDALSESELERRIPSSGHGDNKRLTETRSDSPTENDSEPPLKETIVCLSRNLNDDEGLSDCLFEEPGKGDVEENAFPEVFLTSSSRPGKRLDKGDTGQIAAGTTFDGCHGSCCQPQDGLLPNFTDSASGSKQESPGGRDSFHDVSSISSISAMQAPTEPSKCSSDVSDKCSTPSEQTRKTFRRYSLGNLPAKDLDRSPDCVSSPSEYDTCTSTVDGFLLYDRSLGEVNLEKANSQGIPNIGVEEASNPNCPMCRHTITIDYGIKKDKQRFRRFQAILKLLEGKNIDTGNVSDEKSSGGRKTTVTSEQHSFPMIENRIDVDESGVQDNKMAKRQAGSDSKQEDGSRGTGPGLLGARRHVAETLANNAAAIILLLDHKMCERRWAFSSGGVKEESPSSPNLPDGFSYGEVEKKRGLSSEEDCEMEDTPCLSKEQAKLQHRRSRSFGSSVSRAITDAVNKLEEISHESRNKQYHKLFKFVPEDEGLIVSFSCALVRDILLQGRLYLSENWVCFHSNIFTFETQVTVPMEEILNITKERTAFVVPNAIGIHTGSNKYIFGSLLSRHSTYKQLIKVWNKREMLDETTSQESGSRMDSERDVLDLEDVPTEEGEDADIEEEDADCGLVLAIDHHESRLQCDVHVHAHRPVFQERGTPFRRVSSTTKQIKPSRIQFLLTKILSIVQAVLAISIYKSLRRFIRHQPLLALSFLMFFVLSTSALVLSYKILTFQSADLFHDNYHELSSLGNVFLSHHQKKHEEVSKLQDKLADKLKSMVNPQLDESPVVRDEMS